MFVLTNQKLLKTKHLDFIGPNQCELCYIQLPAEGKELHKTTKPHRNNLWKWFLEQQKGLFLLSIFFIILMLTL